MILEIFEEIKVLLKQLNTKIEQHAKKDNTAVGELPFDTFDSSDDNPIEKLMEMINNLGQEQLDLIELRFFQELSFKEIAEIYSITEANAKMKVYRILEKMNLKWKEIQ